MDSDPVVTDKLEPRKIPSRSHGDEEDKNQGSIPRKEVMLLKEVLDQIPSKIQKLIDGHRVDIEQAFSYLPDDEPLTLSFSAKIGIVKGKKICEVTISFTKEKVRDSLTFSWDDAPLLKTIEGIDKKLKKDGLSMTVSSPGHGSVTLGKEV